MSSESKPISIQTKNTSTVVRHGVVCIQQWSGGNQVGVVSITEKEFEKIIRRMEKKA